MLGKLVSATKAVITDKFTKLYVAAMYILGFHGFLRIGEITVRAGVPIENVIHRNDIVIVPGHVGRNKPSLRLTVRHAKHQQVIRPVVLEITSQSTNCPVAHICRHLQTRGSSAGPLSVFPDKTPMSRTYVAAQLSACLEHPCYDPGLYKCHSFGIGAATTEATRGFTDRQIQIMGRCKSAAFKRYIRIPMMQL